MDLKSLEAYGANTGEGLARCMNDESFYLEMAGMVLADANFDALKAAMDAGDAEAAFRAAHALKGAAGNVALTPIYEPLCELTELLRGRNERVEGDELLLDRIMTLREKALQL